MDTARLFETSAQGEVKETRRNTPITNHYNNDNFGYENLKAQHKFTRF